MKTESHFQQSEESMMVKDFVTKYLYMRPRLPTYERIYQVSQRIAFSGASESCARTIKKLLKGFISDAIKKFSELDVDDVGESLYMFEQHWSTSKCLLSKVFQPIAHDSGVYGEMFSKLFSRLLSKLINGTEEIISNFLLLSIRKEMSVGGSTECNDSEVQEALASEDYSINKKPKLNAKSADLETSHQASQFATMFSSDRFKRLSRSKKILTLVDLLKKQGFFDLFFGKILAYLVSVYKSRIEGGKLSLFEIQDFLNEQRKIEYLKDDFYAIESCLMKEIVKDFTNEEVFKMFRNKKEMELCLDFFCIANEEKGFLEIIKAYHEEIVKSLSVDSFLIGYYLVDLEFRVFYNRGDSKYKEVREGIKECKSRMVNSNVENSIRGVSKWVDALLRGRISIDGDKISGLEGDKAEKMLFPGGDRMNELSTKKILENIGVDSIFLGGRIWEEYLLSDIFRIIGEIFYFCNNKDGFEQVLREGLADRLLSSSYISLDKESLLASSLDVGGVYSQKMRCMLKDFTEKKTFMNCEILFLRVCKWPEYKDVYLDIPEVQNVRERYEESVLKTQRKKVKWIDVLSSCELEMLGVPITVTLVQYSMLRLLIERPRAVEDLKICEFWDSHLKILIRNGLVGMKTGQYFLNMSWDVDDIKISFIPESFSLKDSSETPKAFDETESLKNLLDCQIVKTMKVNKVLDKKELRELIRGNYSQEMFNEGIESLVSREFLEMEDGKVKYLS